MSAAQGSCGTVRKPQSRKAPGEVVGYHRSREHLEPRPLLCKTSEAGARPSTASALRTLTAASTSEPVAPPVPAASSHLPAQGSRSRQRQAVRPGRRNDKCRLMVVAICRTAKPRPHPHPPLTSNLKMGKIVN
ncbi:hypothetical protein NDU88_006934 [Pleurodeles waltl]|uniref:Uncharacterized protein n=1 Tax=Pleurodeles waltl TaxID=8319 RepID=A0AAV7SQY1_PLEWA|nr:hypothetical protein NDU88_006934 [Pleurodeles waltl]